MNIDELDDKFGIEAEIGFYEEDELVYAMVSNKYADATICLYGAHIVSYSPAKNMEVLWMSPSSSFEEGKAIRGGIPVCFPWFGSGTFATLRSMEKRLLAIFGLS